MAAESFPLPDLIDANSVRVESETAVDEVNFGDGYSQAAARGINTIRRKLRCNFQPITTTEKDTIVAFLEARGGAESFNLADGEVPGYSSGGNFRARKWTLRPLGGNTSNWSVSFVAEEVFDLDLA